MKYLFTTFVLLFAIFLDVNGQALGYRSSTQGFFLNGHLNGSSWTLDDLDVDTESGGGIGIGLGYGLTELISLYAQLDAAAINPDGGDTYALAHFDLGAQFTFLSTDTPWRPYLDVALAGRAAEWESILGDIETSGGGISVGGGVKYFISLPVALDLGLKWTVGELSDFTIGGYSQEIEADATSARFTIGISWYPGR